jgi:hypothetical protein
LLQLYPSLNAQLLTLALGIDSQDTQGATIRPAQTFQALDGGGLSSSVRADHAEDLTFLNFKGDIIHGDGGTIVLA